MKPKKTLKHDNNEECKIKFFHGDFRGWRRDQFSS